MNYKVITKTFTKHGKGFSLVSEEEKTWTDQNFSYFVNSIPFFQKLNGKKNEIFRPTSSGYFSRSTSPDGETRIERNIVIL